jgi:hypothetical protein
MDENPYEKIHAKPSLSSGPNIRSSRLSTINKKHGTIAKKTQSQSGIRSELTMSTFRRPEFLDGEVEIRTSGDSVAICGTPHGLTRLAHLCLQLAIKSNSESDHIHLEDYELLTNASLVATLGVFRAGQRN